MCFAKNNVYTNAPLFLLYTHDDEKKMAVAFNSRTRCFVSAATGRKKRGLTRSLDNKTSMYAKNNYGKIAGSKLDKELELYINNQIPPSSPRAKMVLAMLARMDAVPVAAQVPVSTSAAKNIATAIDILCQIPDPDTPTHHAHLFVELKYSGYANRAFATHVNTVDPKLPTMIPQHAKSPIPRTLRNIYLDQLRSNMAMYARTHHTKPGAPLHGVVLVACQDEPYLIRITMPYVPNTGINTPCKKPTATSIARARSTAIARISRKPTIQEKHPRTATFVSLLAKRLALRNVV